MCSNAKKAAPIGAAFFGLGLRGRVCGAHSERN
jgi:hypothetical protein